ncbi:MAG: hypothetical protein ABEJ27_03035 [Halodesulfurarchaeum sp.]
MSTALRSVLRHGVLWPAAMIVVAIAVAVVLDIGLDVVLFGLSILGAGVGLVGVVGVANAGELVEEAGEAGVREADANMMAMDRELPYGTGVTAMLWGGGTFVLTWGASLIL